MHCSTDAQPVPNAVYRGAFTINTTVHSEIWNLGLLTPQSSALATSHYLFCVRDVQEAVHESVNAQNLTGVKDAFATCFGR